MAEYYSITNEVSDQGGRMRSGAGGIFTFIVGLIIGAAGIWIAAHFVSIPGAKQNSTLTSSSSGITTPANTTSTNNNSRNQTTTSTSGLVGGFPSNAPIYQPSSLALSTKSTRGGQAVVYSAAYTSTSDPQTVVSYYQAQLDNNGWHIDSNHSNNGITTITASGHNSQLNVLISGVSGQTQAAGQSAFELAVTPNS